MSEQWPPTEEEQLALVATATEFHRRVAPIIDVRIKPQLAPAINEFLALTNRPETAAKLDDWNHKQGPWKQRLVSGINEHTRKTLTIAAYHCLRLKEMEDRVIEALQGMSIGENQIIAGGGTTAMDAEYEAFILASRRCLDQLTFAIAACFKQNFTSFRRFAENFLSKQSNRVLADALTQTYFCHEANFHEWLFSRVRAKGFRDHIAHEYSVRVGTLNVSLGGIFFVGADVPDPSFEGRKISDVTLDLLFKLNSCVDALVRCVSSEFLAKL